eukprot:gene14252-20225_t
MALMALRTKRYDEADTALKCAMRFGLSEPKLTSSLAEEYLKIGQSQPAIALLRTSLAESESFEGHVHLIEVMGRAGEVGKATAQLHVAAAMQLTPEQEQQLLDMRAKLKAQASAASEK